MIAWWRLVMLNIVWISLFYLVLLDGAWQSLSMLG
jgi:hypothetical protein